MAEEKKPEIPLSQQYPKWKFHLKKAARVVANPEEEQKLGAGWQDKPFPPPEEDETEDDDEKPSKLPTKPAAPAQQPATKK